MGIKVRKLLQWSMMSTGDDQKIFWGLLAWLGVVVDNSMSVSEASDNPLDAPELIGPRGRALKISLRKKMRTAAISAKGKSFKSPHAVLQGRQTLKGGKFVKKHRNANKWIHPYAYKYLSRLREVFKCGGKAPVISIAWDATRLSRKDTLVATIYHSEKRQAGWCPPMVPTCVCKDH